MIVERAHPVGDEASETICEHEVSVSAYETRTHSEQRVVPCNSNHEVI